MICDYMKRKPAIDGFINMHSLDIDVEYSFFLTTDQIKTPQPEPQLQKKIISNNIKSTLQINKINNETDDDDDVTNKFSEVNESSVNFEDYQ